VRLSSEYEDDFWREVSIHAPAWGATDNLLDFIFFQHVSIHAPAWGATDNLLDFIFFQHVSIHAPAWGATIFPLFR